MNVGGVTDNWSVTTKSAVTPGSQSYTTAGAHSFTVPAHNSIIIEVWGAGGGGDDAGDYGKPGGDSIVNGGGLSLSAGGGDGGYNDTAAGGIGSGGDVNTNGGSCIWSTSPKGGASPNGGAGGNAMQNGVAPGGGAGGYEYLYCGGGGGAYVKATRTSAQIPAGTTLNIVVGQGGITGLTQSIPPLRRGGVGRVTITWN